MKPVTPNPSDIMKLRSKTLALLGDLHMQQGDYEAALGFLRDRLALCESAQKWDDAVATHLNMGHAHRMLNNLARSSDEFRKALTLSRAHQLRERIPECLNSIATLFYFQKEQEKALEYYQASLTELRDNGKSPLLARTLMQVGNIHRKLDEYKKADRCYAEASRIFKDLGDEYNLGMTLTNRALLCFAQDEEEPGRAYLREGFERLFYAGAGSEIQLFKATLETVYGIRVP